jgi:hypothetical protein
MRMVRGLRGGREERLVKKGREDEKREGLGRRERVGR